MTQNLDHTVWQSNLGQASEMLTVKTAGQGFYEITREVQNWLNNIQADFGALTVFVCHTSASLVIQENADPDVKTDLQTTMDRLAPRNGNYLHTCEGPDDMPAHIKTMLTSTSTTIPVQNTRMTLGTWQGVYLFEHRDNPHVRRIALHFTGTRVE